VAPPWEAHWHAVSQAFGWLTDELRKCNPSLWCGLEFHQTWRQAFFGAASYSVDDDPAADEDIVVAMQFIWEGDDLRYVVDVIRGDGPFVDEGHSETIPRDTDEATLDRWVAARVGDAVGYIRSMLDVVRPELCLDR
jgi:hypothetical protein